MSINLLTTVQQSLGFAALKKADPNTQDIDTGEGAAAQKLQQAALIAALAGIYNLSRSEEGLITISGESFSSNWAALLFGDNKNELMKNIATFAGADEAQATDTLNKSAAEAVKIIRENTAGQSTEKEIRKFVSAQRDFILPYLPAALNLGKMLDDNTLDDRTNKMEGPLSSLMHKIEKGFSGSETVEEAQRNNNN